LRTSTGYELIAAVCAVFAEVLPAMNLCLQVPLEVRESGSGFKG
jgi:hypothetical protein